MRKQIAVLVLLAVGVGAVGGEEDAKPVDQARIDALIAKLQGEDMAARMAAKKAHEELIEIGRPAVPALLKALDSPETYSRVWAIGALGAIPDPRSKEPLLEAFSDPKPVVRQIVAWHTRKYLKDPRFEEATLKLLEDPVAEVRQWAARALSQRKPTALDNWVRKRLKSEDPKTRREALESVKQALPPEKLDGVMLELLENSPDTPHRVEALQRLMERPERKVETIEILIGWLEALPGHWSEEHRAKLRHTAALAVDRLAGKPFGDTTPSAQDPQSQARKWRAWLEENRESLAKPPNTPAPKAKGATGPQEP
jgi:hypothetical protein